MTLILALGSAFAADHIDAPIAQADPAADISDFYAWHTTTNVYAVVNFAGLTPAGDPAMYDPDVVYGVHIDTNGDSAPDRSIWIRFGQDGLGNWGVQVTNLPGTGAPVSGPVEAILQAPGGRVFAGLREDPFHFDFDGFVQTTTTGILSFDPTNDTFAGSNVTSIVLEMDKGATTSVDNITMWATSARLPAS